MSDGQSLAGKVRIAWAQVRGRAESRRWTLTGAPAMWAVARVLGIVFAGSALPTPLYVIYRKEFHFSEIILTIIYAAYVAGTLIALVFFGRLSDQIGRRKAALPALGVVVASTVIFIFAANTTMLFPARVLSGFACGVFAGTATAWIVELHLKQVHASSTLVAVAFNVGGLALGPLMSGLLAQYAAQPMRLTYIVYLPLVLASMVLAWAPKETVHDPVERLGDVSLRPRMGVPGAIRKQFHRACLDQICLCLRAGNQASPPA
jgi:MFS family permease